MKTLTRYRRDEDGELSPVDRGEPEHEDERPRCTLCGERDDTVTEWHGEMTCLRCRIEHEEHDDGDETA
jgi:hypothetical protein